MNISVDAVLTQPELKLGFGSRFEDLYHRAGLQRLDATFLDFLGSADAALRARLESARTEPEALARKEESELLIAVAGHLDDFISRLFGIEAEVHALSSRHYELAPLFSCKRLFVQRKAMNTYKPEIAAGFDGEELGQKLAQGFGEAFSELTFARHVAEWQKDEAANAEKLDTALRYAAWAAHTPAGQWKHRAGVLFKAPRKLDFQKLVPLDTREDNGVTVHTLSHLRRRHGFALTDSGTDLVGALDQTNYCIWCHEQGRDSCSHGLKEKATVNGAAAPFKKTLFGVANNQQYVEIFTIPMLTSGYKGRAK